MMVIDRTVDDIKELEVRVQNAGSLGEAVVLEEKKTQLKIQLQQEHLQISRLKQGWVFSQP